MAAGNPTQPHGLSRFVGREGEREALGRRLVEGRLVTLTGAGGSGKTRLALQAADDARAWFADGVWVVELADLTDPALVAQAAAAALGVREAPGQAAADALRQFLRDRRALLVLDNCEHLAGACARLAADLLRTGPELRVLATSRQPLGLAGEIVWPVEGLRLPPEHGWADLDALRAVEAVALFVERAAALAPGFALNAENAEAVIRICRRLAGMPLALELAAARLPVLEAAQIAARLDDSLGLLGAGPRLAEPRHRTMRAAIDWSHALLPEPERRAWRRLAVFRGSFSLAAAEAVAGDDAAEMLDRLAALAHHSLVVVTREAGEARYHLLEPLRQYAAEQLEAAGEAEAVRRRHAAYYLDWVERHAPRLRGPEQAAALRQFDARYANLRAALAVSLEDPHGAETGLRLAAALLIYWQLRNMYSEGGRWFEAALARPGAEAAGARGAALFGAAVMAWYQSDHARARRLVEASLAATEEPPGGTPWGRAYRLMMRGQTARFQGEVEAALAWLDESIVQMRQAGDEWGLALALDSLGSVRRQAGDHAGAEAVLRESQAVWQAVGDPWGLALNRMEFFQQAQARGDEAAAQALAAASAATLEALGYTWHLALMHRGLADLALQRGDAGPAAEQYTHALRCARQIGNPRWEAAALLGLGGARAAQGDAAGARARAAEGLRLLAAPDLADAGPALERAAAAAARAGQAGLARQLRAAGAALRQAGAEPGATLAAALSALAADGAAAAAARPTPFGLTPREMDVLRLAAEGLTDPQIAARLVISRRTVHAHLRSIYGKLNVGSRTAAARAAHEHKLV
jgi:predicted ATPase/DNA-binding CsgD family transcriptional regulator